MLKQETTESHIHDADDQANIFKDTSMTGSPTVTVRAALTQVVSLLTGTPASANKLGDVVLRRGGDRYMV